MNTDLKKILDAKDKRTVLRKALLGKNSATLSFNLNIPGYPKTNKEISSFFNNVLSELKIYLSANRIIIDASSEINQTDEAGNFFLVVLNVCDKTAIEIKDITERFEENHALGRLIDVDITDENGNYISSHKSKLCFYCNEKPAIVCMREQKHSYLELRQHISENIDSYLKAEKQKNISRKLSSIALKSVLYEVSLSPKPGLVDFNNSGSHRDMNYYTFLNSSSALSPFFDDFANAGFAFNEDLSEALPIIRNIGIKAEQIMFEATKGVNTQKGIVFLMGISLFSVGYIFSKGNNFDILVFQKTVKTICKDLVKNELANNKLHKTHGELSFKNFGLKGAGARLEVEQGFSIVVDFGLPVLEDNLKKIFSSEKEKINFALRKTLLSIIAKNNDSNILYRKGNKILEKLKLKAKEAFNDDAKFQEICDFCLTENISPGGSADLLAITVFIYFVKEIKNEF